jgi:TolA-binding protein
MNQVRVGFLSTTERLAWSLVEADIEYADKRYAASGLAAMRVVILHPKTPEAGEALFAAARAYEKLDRSAKAGQLYEECVQHMRAPAAVKARAADRIKSMKAAP